MSQKSITKVVITGGPCAGKTTCMSYLRQKLESVGYAVLVIAESATEFLTAGCVPPQHATMLDFEEVLLGAQLAREKLYHDLAEKMHNPKVVILLDRGAMDMKAYLDEKSWYDLLEDTGHSVAYLRDKRYDAVIHLRTAALGAEKFYSTTNNSARLETIEEAIEKDKRTLESWIGHSHLHVIDNSTDFDHKLKRVLEAVLGTLGEPIPMEIERRYLVENSFVYTAIPCPYQVTDIEQVYLKGGFRVRKRIAEGVATYTKTYKVDTDDPAVRFEKEETVSARTYRDLLVTEHEGIPTLRKKRVCFVYREQYFELDIFEDINLIMLEIELTDAQKEVTLPSWLPVVREVTDDLSYRNAELAKRMLVSA